KLKSSGNVLSYENDAELELQIFVDEELIDIQKLNTLKLINKEFNVDCNKVDFETIKVIIKNTDGLYDDNINLVYNVEKVFEYKTLIVSDYPFYLTSVIDTVGNTSVKVISTDSYNENITGYDLYIFDAYTPSKLPKDGTIWLFGIDESLEQTGFSVQDVVADEENGLVVSYPKNSTSQFKKLTSGLYKDEFYVSNYVKYGLHRNFTILATCEGNPVIFAGSAENGCREVVFAFDLHDSNLPLMMDYLTLSQNLLEYSFPVILEDTSYICGDNVNINITSNCKSIRVESPTGNVSYLDVSKETTSFKTTEVGTYTLTMTLGDDIRVFKVYVGMPNEESAPSLELSEIALVGELENNYSDGIYDKLIILFILLAVVYVADWMVYCYEQYQLR
ncbi:MAG: hypothetical protein J6R47_01860, partial [Acholeplasmatales bacterium]|nr:hypothetical protein [Acholeplasmatales bacterium]